MCEYYCGPDTWNIKYRKLISEKFNEACKAHDKNYAEAIYSRSHCDTIFKEDIKRIIKEDNTHKWFWYPIGYSFYYAVKIGGHKHYGKRA